METNQYGKLVILFLLSKFDLKGRDIVGAQLLIGLYCLFVGFIYYYLYLYTSILFSLMAIIFMFLCLIFSLCHTLHFYFKSLQVIAQFNIQITMQKQQKEAKQSQQLKEERVQKIKNLSSIICQDPFNLEHSNLYLQRSEQYHLTGENQSAIADLSKSLYIEPTSDAYVQRGKIYASEEMFYFAMMDFEQADILYKQNKKQQQTEKQIQQNKKQVNKVNQDSPKDRNTIKKTNPQQQTCSFLEHSTVIHNLPQLTKIAKAHEKSRAYMPPQFNTQFAQLMNKLIQQKMSQQNKNYEKLLELVKKQDEKIRELEKNVQEKAVDYEGIFYKQVQESTISDLNKEKCIIYYSTVVSQMERFYLAAKVLGEFDEKISFEDYQSKIKQKGEKDKQSGGFSKKIIQKIFKIFEKHEPQLQRVGEIIKQIPYIGYAFKLIKSSMKVCGWLQKVKLQSECQNILKCRPSVSSFNKMSSKIAYEMYKFFKLNITTQTKPQENKSEIYRKTVWDKLGQIYKKIRRNQMATRVFHQVKPEQKNYVKQMANVHSSILMSGVAFGVFQLPNQYQIQQNQCTNKIFTLIAQLETELFKKQIENDQQFIEICEINADKSGEKQKQNQKVCAIF